MIIQTNASDQITELTVKDLWVGSSTAKGPVDLICQQSLRLQSQIIDTNSHTKYILRWPSLHMTPHNTHSLSLCLYLCFHIIWSTHTFSAFWCSSLCVSLRQDWPRGDHGDLCFLETSCEDPHVWRFHQHAETARCVNTLRRQNIRPPNPVTLGFPWIVFRTLKREKIKRQRILLQL